MGMGTIQIKVEAVPPSLMLNLVLAAMFRNIDEHNVLNVAVTGALFYWDCGINARVLVDSEYSGKMLDIISRWWGK